MFQVNGPIWRFLNLLGDMIFLHLLWLICSIPLITIGPATTAAHYTALKIVRDEGRGVWYLFFKSFRQNFRQGMVLGLIFLPTGLILILDFYLCLYKVEAGGTFQFVMLAALGFLTILYLIEMIYMWAVLAWFDNKGKQTVIRPFLLAMSNFGETSVMLAQDLLLGVVAVVCFAFFPQVAVLFVIFGLPLVFVVNSFKLRTIFDRYGASGENHLDR